MSILTHPQKHIVFSSYIKNRRRRASAGLTIIETMMAAGVGMIFVIGAIVLANQAFSAGHLATAEQDLQATVASVQSLYAGASSFPSTISTDFLATDWPPDMDNNGSITDAWGGAASISQGPTSGTFDITYVGVPSNACVKMTTGSTASGEGNLQFLAINGTQETTLPISVATAESECSNSGSGANGGNTIDFYFD